MPARRSRRPAARDTGSVPDPGDGLGQVRRDVLRRGLAVLGVAIRAEPRMFTLSVLASALFAGMTVATATVLGAVVSRVVLPAFADGRTTAGALVLASLAMIGVAVLKAVGVIGRRLGAGIMQYRMQARSRRAATAQYLRLPMAWHAQHPTGQLLSVVASDAEAAWIPIAPLPFAVGVVVMLVVAGIALFLADPVIAVVGLAVFPSVFVLNYVFQKQLAPRAMQAQRQRGRLSAVAHESIDGAQVVRLLGREQAEVDKFAADAEHLRDTLVAVGRVRGLFDPLLEALPNIGVLVVLLVGSQRVQSGAIDTGTLVTASYLFTLLTQPLRAFGWVLGGLPNSVVGFDRVQSVLDATGELPHGEQRLTATGPAALHVRGVTIGYATGGPVLQDLDLDVAAGATVALVGPTGSGKSTFVGLLSRLVDPDAGTVRLDGVDLRDLAAGEVSRAVALVGQQAYLFDDTIRGNITLDDPAITDAQVWEALRVTQAETFVRALPHGLDTEVGERGATLSGGQRQRLSLARAVVRRPRLLVLDDATSAVDPAVEQAILAGLRENAGAATVVVVAYRQATIALADEVLWLLDGRVQAAGTHTGLLARVPAYADLVSAYRQADAEHTHPGHAESQVSA